VSAGDDYRFDLVADDDQWACLIWECCRLGGEKIAREKARMRTLERARTYKEFPGTPWLRLPSAVQKSTVDHWRDRSKKPNDGASLLPIIPELLGATSEEECREKLANFGWAVFHFGMKGRLTRAQMLTRFKGLLDANPDWIAAKKVIPGYGKRSPGEALRRIAWDRLMKIAEANEGRRTKVDFSAIALASETPKFKRWLNVPTSPAKRSQWRREARNWTAMICDGDRALFVSDNWSKA